jgi:hypothetical protein
MQGREAGGRVKNLQNLRYVIYGRPLNKKLIKIKGMHMISTPPTN